MLKKIPSPPQEILSEILVIAHSFGWGVTLCGSSFQKKYLCLVRPIKACVQIIFGPTDR